jgi:hypothetical protein
VFQTRTLDKQENTPLVVDGVMYTIQSPNDVIALDAATGKTIWTYLHKPAPGTRNPCCGNLTRGVAILGDKLFLATLDAQMIAINAKTGKELWKTEVADYKQQYSMTVAPRWSRQSDHGAAGGEHGIRGFIAAYDVNTGRKFEIQYGSRTRRSGLRNLLGKDGKPNDSYLHWAPIWLPVPDPETNSPCGAPHAGPIGMAMPGSATTSTAPRWSRSMPTRQAEVALSVLAQRVRLGCDPGSGAGRYQFQRQPA